MLLGNIVSRKQKKKTNQICYFDISQRNFIIGRQTRDCHFVPATVFSPLSIFTVSINHLCRSLYLIVRGEG